MDNPRLRCFSWPDAAFGRGIGGPGEVMAGVSELWRGVGAALALSLGVVGPAGAASMTFNVRGDHLVATGPIRPGTGKDFIAFLARPEISAVRVVELDSSGGRIGDAVRMARLIRQKKWATLVDARAADCASACTMLFAAGVRRHYVHAEAVTDGVFTLKENRRGLGFHQAHRDESTEPAHFSAASTATVTRLLHELGVDGAVGFVARAAPDHMYRVSAKTALDAGIATSLGAP